jgi:transcription-repair coupling factor (superfamily II helicase)
VVDTALLVQRSEVLDSLSLARRFILVASANAVIEKVASADMFRDRVVDIRKGDRLEPHGLKAKMVEQGYDLVGFVDEPGEVAVRGGIVDVFSFSGHLPVRLEFFGDKVESIREFDPGTQRSVESLDKIRIIPNASEMPAERMMSLLSHLPKESTVILQQPGMVLAAVEERDRKGKRAEQLFLSANEFVLQVEERPRLFLGSTERLQSDASFALDARPQPDFNSSIKLLRQDLQRLSQEGVETLILCDSDNQQSRLQELLGETTSSLKYNLTVESLHSGFVLPGEGVAVYTDHQIFNRFFRAKRHSKRYHRGLSFKEMRDLHREDLVVHDDFGIGRFMGFETIQVEKTPHEVVVLEYSDGARLNVHVSAVHKVSKYSGREGSEAQISRLGSGEWARKKASTKRRLKDITDGLIKLYAKRRTAESSSSAPDGHWQTEMEARFEFEETPDQMIAIKEVKRDMEKSAAMDRLVCGDVGFGKTEVAIRAAFKTVMNGQQVAVIAPTTILVDQHSRTFNRRMQDFPVRIESLSRFRSSADLKKITADISTGNIDIAIGTHRLGFQGCTV